MAESTFLDSYCERAGILGLTQEPFNVASNAAFIITAIILLYRQYQTVGFSLKIFDITLLPLTIIAIGIGSTLWHLYAASPYIWADIIPITFFLNLYFVVFLLRIAKVGKKQTFLAWALFQIITWACQTYLPQNLMHGTIMYLPAFVILCIMMLYIILTFHPATSLMIKAFGIWIGSLFFRTIDLGICAFFPVGTHFIWHILNAIVLYILVRVVQIYYKPKEN